MIIVRATSSCCHPLSTWHITAISGGKVERKNFEYAASVFSCAPTKQKDFALRATGGYNLRDDSTHHTPSSSDTDTTDKALPSASFHRTFPTSIPPENSPAPASWFAMMPTSIG